MRFVILKDKKITPEQLAQLQREFTDLVKQYTDLTPQFFIHEEDYSDVPTYTDPDGDTMPTVPYVKALMDKVHCIYGNWGTDSVVMLIHRDNWIYKGIWGTNWSHKYHTYHVHFCRFDNRNMANSLGTLYHEWMHSLDVLIKTHTGFDINTLFKNEQCWVDWDNTIIHANRFKGCTTERKYIRWKESTDALAKIAPHLKKAYNVRREMYLEPYKQVQKRVIDWLKTFIYQKSIGQK